MANIATASSLAKEIRDFSIVDINRASFYRRSRKNKYSYGMLDSVGKVCTIQPICHEDRQGE